jgi:hypothetical protein
LSSARWSSGRSASAASAARSHRLEVRLALVAGQGISRRERLDVTDRQRGLLEPHGVDRLIEHVLEPVEVEALGAAALQHLAHAHVLEARESVEEARVVRGDDPVEERRLAAVASR